MDLSAEPQPFRFLDLPAELRNRIYDLLVVTHKPIKVTSYLQVRTSVYGLSIKQIEGLRAITSLVSATLMEAAPVLYGSGVFYFTSSDSMREFLAEIGSMTRYIRRIRVTARYSKTYLRSALHQLKQATSLQTLELEPPHSCTAAQTAILCEPFLKALLKIEKGKGGTADVAGKIHTFFTRSATTAAGKLEEKKKAREYEAEFQKEVRKILA